MKRTDLITEILREIKKTKKTNKTKQYLTKTEIIELLLYLKKIKKELEDKTKEKTEENI